MKKSELKERIKELEKEVTRLNGVIEGMEKYARIMRPPSYPMPVNPPEPWKAPNDWWDNGTWITCGDMADSSETITGVISFI